MAVVLACGWHRVFGSAFARGLPPPSMVSAM
jgi:hypothetical protein